MTELTIFDSPLQNKIASLLITGLEAKEIAKTCDCRVETVYGVLKTATYARFAYDSAAQRLVSEGFPAAVDQLIECVKDSKASRSARNTAADKLLQHTGMIVNEHGKLEKSPSNMSAVELHERLKQLQDEAANRAKPAVIEHEQPIDIDELLS